MEKNQEYVGYLEYHGNQVADGLLDARKAAKALIGLDKAVRHFVALQNRDLREVDFDIPVLVTKGSWLAYIPGIIVTAYLTQAAAKIAENDFKDVGLKTVIKKALIYVQFLIKLGKHLGSLETKEFEGIRWRNGNTEVGIPRGDGEILWVPKVFLDMYLETPANLLSDLASLIEPERQMRIGVLNENRFEVQEISEKDKPIFYIEADGTILFPELKHGQSVVLEGVLTRGNENTNSMGLRYLDHILNCVPLEGSIVRFKHALFLKCKVIGTVDRNDEFGNPIEKKPKIVFKDIQSLEEEPKQPSLLLEPEQ